MAGAALMKRYAIIAFLGAGLVTFVAASDCARSGFSTPHCTYPPVRAEQWCVNPGGSSNGAGSTATGSVLNIHTWNLAPQAPWVSSGIDIVAAP